MTTPEARAREIADKWLKRPWMGTCICEGCERDRINEAKRIDALTADILTLLESARVPEGYTLCLTEAFTDLVAAAEKNVPEGSVMLPGGRVVKVLGTASGKKEEPNAQ